MPASPGTRASALAKSRILIDTGVGPPGAPRIGVLAPIATILGTPRALQLSGRALRFRRAATLASVGTPRLGGAQEPGSRGVPG
jgi:hypothetical protein